MKKMILSVISLFVAGNLAAQEASTAVEQVPIEEYVPKVIIEGKWGTGPGEFGLISDPMQAEYFGVSQEPNSLVVNSKGEIFVLDHVNNRIQKFTPKGEFLKALAIPGCADEKGGSVVEIERYSSGVSFNLETQPVFIGINIVIDSKDNLYYYLKRVKDGKETGEVWEFRNDKLVKKTVVPVTKALSYGVGLDLDREDDSLWIPDVDKNQQGKHYQFRTGKILGTDDVRAQKAAFRASEAGKKAVARPKPKYYLDIETSSNGIRVIEKLN